MKTQTETLCLRDRASGLRIWLTLRDGMVVGAMGSDPKRYLGLTEAVARHRARHGGWKRAEGSIIGRVLPASENTT